MLASVLNPPANKSLAKSHSSILPLLARGHGEAVEVEGLIRPRMPVLGITYGSDMVEDERMEGGDLDDEMEDRDDDDGDETGMDDVAGMEKSLREELGSIQAQPAFPRQPNSTTIAPLADSTAPSSLKRPPPVMPLPSPDTKKPRHTTTQPALQPASASQKPSQIRFINSSLKSLIDDEQGPADNEAAVTNVPSPSITTATTEDQVVASTATNVAAPSEIVEDDDDDDFEIPELNMDPDTEDEEIDEI